MQVRIEMADTLDLAKSLKSLRGNFPKQTEVYFPPKEAKGANSFGFHFSGNRLLDWDFIARWCDLRTEYGEEPNSCVVIACPKSIEAMFAALPVLNVAQKSSQEFLCTLWFKLEDSGSSFEINISNDNDPDEVSMNFSFDDLDLSDTDVVKVIEKVWGTAKKKFTLLKHVTASFDDGSPNFEIPIDALEVEDTNSGFSLKLNTPTSIKTGWTRLFEFAKSIQNQFQKVSYFVSARVLAEDAPKSIQLFSDDVDADSNYHFEGVYHKSFDPDQVLREFPKEGYWYLPLFEAQLGKRDETAQFYLVQTPNERFFETDVINDEMLERLKKLLKSKSELLTWTGPLANRWNLHKLKKKK